MQKTLTMSVLLLILSGIALAPLCLNYNFDVSEVTSDESEEDAEIREPCSENIRPTLDNIDHFDWTYCSHSLRPIWRALKIRDETEFQRVSSLSEASSVWYDLDRDGKPERILRLTLRTAQDARVRFVILKYTPGPALVRWQSLAHLDIVKFHLAPEPRVVSSTRASWLAIANVERAWGDEVVQENEQWYELQDGRLIEVLRFPLEGEAVSGSQLRMERRIQSDVMAVSSDEKGDSVAIAMTAQFRWGSPGKAMEVRRKITFSRDLQSQQFAFDPLRSDVQEMTYRLVYDLTNDGFTYDALTQFAQDIGQPLPR
jgi:hypothetical protein